MNSKKMSDYTGIFLILAVTGVILEWLTGDDITGIFPMIIMSGLYCVGSALMKKLELIHEEIKSR
jgi:hypothetical protein